MVATTQRITLDEVERGGGPEGMWEVIDGEIVEVPLAGLRHGRIGTKIAMLVGAFAYAKGLGYVSGADTGFVLTSDPLTLRAPDVSFVRTERLPPDFDDGGYLRLAPDLAVEVISPSDRSRDVLAKAVAWLDAGASLVWLVDPVAQTVTVYRPDGPPRLVVVGQALDGGDVLPGLAIPVTEIFAIS